MSDNGDNGARGKALGEGLWPPTTGPCANLPQEGKVAGRELMRTGCLPSKLVFLAGAATKSWCGLPSGAPKDVTIMGISYICAHVPMSPRARTSVPDDWLTIKVTEICGDGVPW